MRWTWKHPHRPATDGHFADVSDAELIEQDLRADVDPDVRRCWHRSHRRHIGALTDAFKSFEISDLLFILILTSTNGRTAGTRLLHLVSLLVALTLTSNTADNEFFLL